jgi:hypothetical protein
MCVALGVVLVVFSFLMPYENFNTMTTALHSCLNVQDLVLESIVLLLNRDIIGSCIGGRALIGVMN